MLLDILLTSLLEVVWKGRETYPRLVKLPVSKVYKDKLIMKKEKLDHDSSKWDSGQVSHSKNLIGLIFVVLQCLWMPLFLKMIILGICWHCEKQTLNLETE